MESSLGWASTGCQRSRFPQRQRPGCCMMAFALWSNPTCINMHIMLHWSGVGVRCVLHCFMREHLSPPLMQRDCSFQPVTALLITKLQPPHSAGYRLDTAEHVLHISCRIVGPAEALQRALRLVSQIVRDNPPKERPGGPPLCLQPLLGAPTSTMPSATLPALPFRWHAHALTSSLANCQCGCGCKARVDGHRLDSCGAAGGGGKRIPFGLCISSASTASPTPWVVV